ncbi:MAG: hypothetical protein HZA91_10095 [Verrucomicrobia bacterium]|nr:hypothetical protein [Verrucomicrobiota bacterium]
MSATAPNASRAVWQRLGWLAVYAAAMGILEAICVIYLRRLFPVETNFPIPPLERLHIELIREACTIVMLVAVAWLSGINLRSRLACFFCAFGIWDILYYVGLWWLSGWPDSLWTWDCLFLIPKPWYGPVLAPVLISLYFVLGCCWLHAREIRGEPVRLSAWLIGSQLLAFAVWYWSFVKDADHISVHAYKGVSYSWPLFIVGVLIGVVGLALASRSSQKMSFSGAQPG